VAIVGAAEWMMRVYGFINPTDAERAIAATVKAVVLFGAAYASTTFLLLAVGAVRGGRGVLERLWRLRIVLDALVTAGLMWFGRGDA
jgi:hypothetical protein